MNYIFILGLILIGTIFFLPMLEKILTFLKRDMGKFIRQNTKKKNYDQGIFKEKNESYQNNHRGEIIYFSPYQIKKLSTQADIAVPYSIFLLFSFISSIATLSLYTLFCFTTRPDYSPSIFLFLMFSYTVGAAYLPHFYLLTTARKRIKTVDKHIASFIDLVLICLDAGLTLNQAMDFVAEECKKTSPLLAHELKRTNLDSLLFLDKKIAFDNLQERVPSKKIAQFVAIMQQHLSEGTVIHGSLHQLSVNVYHENMSLINERAQKMPALLSAMVVIFTLPMIFIVSFGPYAQGLSKLFK